MATVTQSFSQTLFTYGPGAMLDLPEHAVVVGGLQDWNRGRGGAVVEEERLRAILHAQLGRNYVLRTPPVHDDANWKPDQFGIGVRIFPQWFVCDDTGQVGSGTNDADGLEDIGRQMPGETYGTANRDEGGQRVTAGRSRRRLVEWSVLNVNSNGQLSFNDGGRKAVPVSPVRFVGACPTGHLQDLDWRFLVHRNADRNCQKPMFWVERGVGSDPADIAVECTCRARMTLADLYKPGFLGDCRGSVPWYGWAGAREDCDNQLRLLSRSATNAYFPQTVTIISLPPEDDELTKAVSEHWSTISSLRNLPNFLEVLRALPATADTFKPFADDQITRAVNGFAQETTKGASRDPRIDEFGRLACGAPVIGADTADSRLYAETLDRKALQLSGFADHLIDTVVQVHRLREVTCLYGFTRLEPSPSASEAGLDEIQLDVNAAKLAEDSDWLPATENFGEGIFIRFREDTILGWTRSDPVRDAVDRTRQGENTDAQHRGLPPAHLGVPYWAIHSLSHALMKELSLECGYPLSALKERIYAGTDTGEPRFGLLIYTAATGGQGTLGGLSSQVGSIGKLLHDCKRRLSLCSNDPVCSEHKPGHDDSRPLHGAACHACLLVPETSCEARNERLDRNLLTATVAGDASGLLE